MPGSLNTADRRIIWAVCGLLVLLTIAAVFSGKPQSEPLAVPSSYASTPGGARAAFLLLENLGLQTQRWEEPPLRLPALASGAAYVLVQPTETPSHAEKSALREFVEQGGRVLFCGNKFEDFFPSLSLHKISKPRSLGVATLGRGEVIWWAAATPLTNASIAQQDNLPFFLASVGFGTRKVVIWDEYFHGERGSLWAYIGRVPAIRWSLLPLGLLVAAVLFTFSRRSGPIIGPRRVSRLSPLEFVDSLGTLYRKARASSVPVAVTAKELRLSLVRNLALPADTPDAVLANQAAIRLGWRQEKLEQVFAQARATATTRSPRPAVALELVRELQRFTQQTNGKVR
jgi:Domain of unknown function (DUF4350)